jgi:hypothetical protein
MTISEKLAWLNEIVCLMEGESGADPSEVGHILRLGLREL